MKASFFIVFAACATGCGGVVIEDNSGGAGGTTSSHATTGAVGTTSAPSTTTSVASTGTGVDPCAGMPEVECLNAYPKCQPVYDDQCCPTCNVGGCADCEHFVFDHCATANGCATAPSCGFWEKEQCTGAPAVCASSDCDMDAGCTKACKPDGMGNCDTFECHPVTKGECTSACDIPSPACPLGMFAEQNGACYTGFCVPDVLCGLK